MNATRSPASRQPMMRSAARAHEGLGQPRVRREVDVEVGGQEGGGGEAGDAGAEAALEVEGVARGLDRRVVELVASHFGARGAHGAAGAQPGPAVAEGEAI